MLIVGLGNPGKQYDRTRHNIGFRAVDILSDCLNFSYQNSSKFKCEIASGNFQNNKVIVIKPQTYMNLSGESVSAVKNYYNIPLDDIIVIHDEIDLPLGEARIKQGGGSAGHNGLKSLDKHIGNNYHRLRLGVGRPQNQMEVSDYVLQNFSQDEENIIENEYFTKLAKSYSELISKNFASIVSKAKK